MRGIILKCSAIVMGLLGVISLFMTTAIIFNLFGMRALEGNYVPFIVYANFICGLLYLIASYYFFIGNRSAMPVLILASAILIVAFAALLIYINDGGIYETKTVKAMTFRTMITLLFAGIAVFYFRKQKRIAGKES